jgi:hypothetical protein
MLRVTGAVCAAAQAKSLMKLEHSNKMLRHNLFEFHAPSQSQPALQHELLWPPHLVQQTAGVDHLWPALIQRCNTQQAHARLQLLGQYCEMLASPIRHNLVKLTINATLDTLCAVRSERIQERPANTNRCCAQTQRLEHIVAVSQSTIKEDLQLADNLRAVCTDLQ